MSDNVKKIEIYKQIENFVTPIAQETMVEIGEGNWFSKTAESHIGDNLIIINEEVFIRHWGKEPDTFVKPLYDAKFVRLNPTIFEKL